MSDQSFQVESNFGHDFSGWWWGVWQDGRLVGFGAAYRLKGMAFRHEHDSLRCAKEREMKTMECTCPYIERRERQTKEQA